ncbi:MAG TPA: hypothetical protein VFH38_09815 [Jatrophihabitans sp.]|nr:hypothetical protein [Jatrophihabitans sp.]
MSTSPREHRVAASPTPAANDAADPDALRFADLAATGVQLSERDTADPELLARRLVDEHYVEDLDEARVAAARLLALARAAAERGAAPGSDAAPSSAGRGRTSA